MDNSFFVFTNDGISLEIERFHICTWEFNNRSSLIEFGCEVSSNSITSPELSVTIFIPWFTKSCTVSDLYGRLSSAENSRFIFNDSITSTQYLDGGNSITGVVHKFRERDDLCVLPIKIEKGDKRLHVNVNLQSYHSLPDKPNIYFRFWIEPISPDISIRKNGIGKSTIIYDIKINERRNIPDEQVEYLNGKTFCRIGKCFLFNIIPNKYDMVFFDSTSLKTVRTLEYDSFNKYLGDKRVKKDELLVVFNKKQNSESFSFFSIFAKELIGPGQYVIAVLVNILCGIVLFIPSYRKSFHPEKDLLNVWKYLPPEIYIALGIALLTLLFFIKPLIRPRTNR